MNKSYIILIEVLNSLESALLEDDNFPNTYCTPCPPFLENPPEDNTVIYTVPLKT